jgi:hypothetical protein
MKLEAVHLQWIVIEPREGVVQSLEIVVGPFTAELRLDELHEEAYRLAYAALVQHVDCGSPCL